MKMTKHIIEDFSFEFIEYENGKTTLDINHEDENGLGYCSEIDDVNVRLLIEFLQGYEKTTLENFEKSEKNT